MDPQCFAWQVIPQLAFCQRSSLLCDCVTWETALHMGLSSKLHPLQMCLVSRDLPHSSLYAGFVSLHCKRVNCTSINMLLVIVLAKWPKSIGNFQEIPVIRQRKFGA